MRQGSHVCYTGAPAAKRVCVCYGRTHLRVVSLLEAPLRVLERVRGGHLGALQRRQLVHLGPVVARHVHLDGLRDDSGHNSSHSNNNA